MVRMIKFIRSDEFRRLSARIAAAVMLAACVATFCAHSAGASPITLGTASNYGVLLGTGDTLKVTGGFNVAGNLGLGNSDTINKGGSNAVSGAAPCAAARCGPERCASGVEVRSR